MIATGRPDKILSTQLIPYGNDYELAYRDL